ncbi:unnamed protein product [Toxocara canis]|uniref:AC_N domain-containing protein n=1 Tax=Toxocara canis TaxID=6265 RepID=A0A183U023_TOXCA|nr:unnamed protein product [Toxocara canis]
MADREVICSQHSTISSKTDVGNRTMRRIFLIMNSVFGVLNVIAFCFSPAYPSTLVAAFFFTFDSLRETLADAHSPAIDSLMSLLLGAILTCLLGASVVTFLFSPLAQSHLNTFSVYSIFILIFTELLLFIILNVLYNFGVRGSFISQCVVNVVMQALCCITLIASQHGTVDKWADLVGCILLCLFVVFSWFLFPSAPKEERLDLSAYTARIGSIALEHDKRIEEVRELTIEKIHERVLIEITIVFNEHCPLDEALRSAAELRNKYLKLHYVYKAFVRCY